MVPWVELIVGAMFAFGIMAPWSALAAGALLFAFTALIARRLADGSRPPCGCFGLRSTRPLGPVDLVRNTALIGLVLVSLSPS